MKWNDLYTSHDNKQYKTTIKVFQDVVFELDHAALTTKIFLMVRQQDLVRNKLFVFEFGA